MRLRLLIPAALAAAATYLALVRDEVRAPAVATPPRPPADVPPPGPAPIAQEPSRTPAPGRPPVTAQRPAAPSIFEDLAPAPPSVGPSLLDILAGEPVAPPAAAEAVHDVVEETIDLAPRRQQEPPTPEIAGEALEPVLEEGRFALGGWAASAGHSVVSAVTFRRRLEVDATADRIVLLIDGGENIPEGGLVVLSDPGFAPDRDGFTLLLAAAAPGPFSAAGSYRVLAPR